MKNTRMLPAELVEYTYEHHFKRMDKRSGLLYVVVLLCLVLASGALLIISVQVVVKGNGILTGSRQRTWVKAPVAGRVSTVHVTENQAVAKGDVLFTLESSLLEEDLVYLRQKKAAVQGRITDLKKLTAWIYKRKLTPPGPLRSAVYARQYDLFEQRARGIHEELREAEASCQRYEYLFEAGVVAAMEFDKHRMAFQEVHNRLNLVYQEQGSRWQLDLNELSQELQQLASAEKKLHTQRGSYEVRAPADGILQEMDGLHAGAFFDQGEQAVLLSPDSGLLARIAIPPADIGLIRRGMPVHLQIDAFNYRQWGAIQAVVSDISGDVFQGPDRNPFFEVRCKLGNKVLALKNGYQGRLKQGMTLQARFPVTRRTLFQLLFDDVNDWLNPYEKNKG
ncbi:MAG: HlyD family efflux transporter periplasmic adaptor subunit [Solitalea sp.]